MCAVPPWPWFLIQFNASLGSGCWSSHLWSIPRELLGTTLLPVAGNPLLVGGFIPFPKYSKHVPKHQPAYGPIIFTRRVPRFGWFPKTVKKHLQISPDLSPGIYSSWSSWKLILPNRPATTSWPGQNRADPSVVDLCTLLGKFISLVCCKHSMDIQTWQ